MNIGYIKYKNLVTLLTLFVIKSKIKKELAAAGTYFIIAVSLLIAIRIVDALITYDVFYIPFLQETMVLILSLFLLLATIRLYMFVKESGEEIKE